MELILQHQDPIVSDGSLKVFVEEHMYSVRGHGVVVSTTPLVTRRATNLWERRECHMLTRGYNQGEVNTRTMSRLHRTPTGYYKMP